MITKKGLLAFMSLVVMTTFAFAQDAGNVTAGDTTVSGGDVKAGDDSISGGNVEAGDVNVDDLMGDLDSDTGSTSSGKWGYNDTITVQVGEATSDSITLISPKVVDGNGQAITRYKVSYSTNHINETIGNTDVKEQTIDISEVTGDNVSLKVTGLDTTKGYYFVVTPLTKDNVAGEPSKEVVYTPSESVKANNQIMEHGASDNQLALQGVSHELSGNKITIKWTPANGASKIKISMKQLQEGVDNEFKVLGEPKMSEGKYSFDITSTGDYVVNLLPIDDNGNGVGAEVNYTIKVDKVEKVTTVKKAPKVGPETNLLIGIMLIAILLYVVYRFRRA